MSQRTIGMVAVATVLMLVGASCGDDDDSTASTDAQNAGSQNPATDEGGDADAATGDPIRIVQVEPYADDPTRGQAGAEAAIEAINAAGGIDGRPIEHEVCDGSDRNKADACARDAVADESVLAMVANDDFFGGVNEIAASAELPIIANVAVTQADFQCTVCFALYGGQLGVGGAAAVFHDLVDVQRMGVAYIDVPAGQALTGTLNAFLESRGTEVAASVPVPTTASDFGPIVAAFPDDIDGVIIGLPLELGMRFIDQARRSGEDYPMMSVASVVTPEALTERIGDAATDIYITSGYDFTSAGYEAYQADMAAIGKAGTLEDNELAINAWLGVRLLQHAIEEAGGENGATRESVMAVLRGTSNYDTQGLTPRLDFTTPQAALDGAFPAIFNLAVVGYQYDPESQELVRLGEGGFTDPVNPPS